MLVVPALVLAAEPATVEPFVTPYLKAQRYCETGKWGNRSDAKYGFVETAFRLCAQADGRFMLVEHLDRDRRIWNWSDARKFYRHSEFGSFYREYALSELEGLPFMTFRTEGRPAMRSLLFVWIAPPRSFESFKAVGALATPQRLAFERVTHPRETLRLWVAAKDGSIVRFERLQDGAVMHFVDIASQQIDRPIGDADLTHRVPLLTRYSLSNDLPVFMAALFVVDVCLAALSWIFVFVRAASPETVLRARRRLWRVQLWAAAASAGVLALLSAFALVGHDTGHPPAIFFVLVLGVWCAIVLALAAVFILTSYLVQPLLQLGRRK